MDGATRGRREYTAHTHTHTEKSGNPTKSKNPYNNKCATKFAERLAFA